MSNNYEFQTDLHSTLSEQMVELNDNELDNVAGGGLAGALVGGLSGAIVGGVGAYAGAAYDTLVDGKPFDTSKVDNAMVTGAIAGAVGGAIATGPA